MIVFDVVGIADDSYLMHHTIAIAFREICSILKWLVHGWRFASGLFPINTGPAAYQSLSLDMKLINCDHIIKITRGYVPAEAIILRTAIVACHQALRLFAKSTSHMQSLNLLHPRSLLVYMSTVVKFAVSGLIND